MTPRGGVAPAHTQSEQSCMLDKQLVKGHPETVSNISGTLSQNSHLPQHCFIRFIIYPRCLFYIFLFNGMY